ncbi:hypothetical protein DL95DRAFT_16202 [Leptodontidium sp. 2 PMI_412]|nr:hypothetical protein DL95DRAFT_16202 [Leptodontidium sp. 2 PMI_412]
MDWLLMVSGSFLCWNQDWHINEPTVTTSSAQLSCLARWWRSLGKYLYKLPGDCRCREEALNVPLSIPLPPGSPQTSTTPDLPPASAPTLIHPRRHPMKLYKHVICLSLALCRQSISSTL